MTPTLLSAFWTYTLITAMTPGPNNILALSSATTHGFRQSTRVLAGMSLGFLIVMLLCAGISFSLAVIDPAAVHLLSWGRGGIYCLAGVENRYQSNKGRWASDKTNQFLGQLCFAVCERQNHFVWHYSTVDVCLPQTQALSWIIGVSVLLAMIGTFGNVCWALAGHLFQRLFRQYGRPIKYRARAAAGLLRGTHFLLMKKRKRSPSSA
ncbi:putative transporter [Escherichia coli]|uniref:Putative transporter n=3 Tax=root TaxID=1 RepID=A0A376L9A4_ECOLX|nr:putative transporter [Escherichia coli]